MQAVQSAIEVVKQATGAVQDKVVPQPPKEPDEWLKADEVEVDPAGRRGKDIGDTMLRMIQHNFDAHQHHYRATHVKTLGIVRGEIKISSNLPSHLQLGLFANPEATYQCIARYANEPSFILPDNTRAPRGLGLKIFGVPGDRLNEKVDKHTQDFLFNNSPMIELTDIDTCLEIVKLREAHFDSPTRLQLELAKRSDRMKQFAPGMLPNVHVVGAEMFTQSAFAFGPYVAHFSLRPANPHQVDLGSQLIPSDASATYHREDLHDYYATNSATYVLRAQFASDISKHPVEDASVEWDEGPAPWHDLATLTFGPQETMSDARRIWWEHEIGSMRLDSVRGMD